MYMYINVYTCVCIYISQTEGLFDFENSAHAISLDKLGVFIGCSLGGPWVVLASQIEGLVDFSFL